MVAPVAIPTDRIVDFCRRWRVQEFALFGSVLRPDFGPESDIDVLVAFRSGDRPSLERWLDMRDELHALFGRDVDLVERRNITNPYRRHVIMMTRRVLYAA